MKLIKNIITLLILISFITSTSITEINAISYDTSTSIKSVESVINFDSGIKDFFKGIGESIKGIIKLPGKAVKGITNITKKIIEGLKKIIKTTIIIILTLIGITILIIILTMLRLFKRKNKGSNDTIIITQPQQEQINRNGGSSRKSKEPISWD